MGSLIAKQLNVCLLASIYESNNPGVINGSQKGMGIVYSKATYPKVLRIFTNCL